MLILYELKKQLEKPFVWVCLAASVLINLWVLVSEGYSCMKISQQNQAVSAIGTTLISEENTPLLVQYLDEEYLTSVMRSGTGNPAEWLEFDIGQNVLLYSSNAYESGAKPLIMEISEPVFAERLNELQTNGENLHINGGEWLLGIVIPKLLMSISFECAVFAVLISVKIGGHEFSEKTANVVYSTKTGRSLGARKLAASLIAAALFHIVLTAVSALLLFIICPCGNLLSAPAFLENMKTGNIVTWIQMSVGEFILTNAAFSLLLTLVFGAFGYSVWGMLCSVPAAVFGALGISTAPFALGFFILPGEGLWRLFFASCPTSLIIGRAGFWFCESRNSVAIPGFEMISAVLWGAITLAFVILAVYRLKRVKL